MNDKDPLGLFTDEKDPLGLFSNEKPAPKQKTNTLEDIGIGLASAVNTAQRGLAGFMTGPMRAYARLRGMNPDEAIAGVFDMQKAEQKKRMDFVNPENKEQSFGGKVISTVAGLPMFPVNAVLGPMDTAMTFMDKGESKEQAAKAMTVDMFGNALGLAYTPFAKTLLGAATMNAGVNAAQETAVRGILENLAETPEGKKAFELTWETPALAAIVGGGSGLLAGPRGNNRSAEQAKVLDDIRKAAKEQAPKAPESQTKLQDEVLKRMELEALDRYNNDRTVERLERALAQKNEPLPPISVDAQGRAWLGDEVNVKNYFDADQQILDRQRALEEEVARQTNLDMNAAARQRMENAPTGYADWAEGLRQDANTRQGSGPGPINFERTPMLKGRKKKGSNLPMDASKFPDVLADAPRAKEPGLDLVTPEDMALPITIVDMLREGFDKTDPFNRYSPQQTARRILIEGETPPIIKSGRPDVGTPTKKSKGRRRGGRQSGAIDVSPLDDAFNQLSYRLLSLERLPKKDVITQAMVQGVLGQQDLAQADKQMLKEAFDSVAQNGKANRQDLVEAVDLAQENFGLYKKPVDTYSDYGIERLGYQSDRQREQAADMWVPEGEPDAPVQRGATVGAKTNIWRAASETNKNNHFRDESYFGHTRNFTDENGVRHVVEIQSDLAQRFPNKPADEAEIVALERLYQDNTKQLNLITRYADIDDIVNKLSDYNPDIALVLSDSISRNLEKRGIAVDTDVIYNNIKKISDANKDYEDTSKNRTLDIEGVRYGSLSTRNALSATIEAVNKYIDNVEWLAREQALKLEELKGNQQAQKVKPMVKDWEVRLIRQELADAAKNGEQKVRFGDADTVAKVEGWPNRAIYLEEEIKYYKEKIKDIADEYEHHERIIEENKNEPMFADVLDFARQEQDNMRQRIVREVENMKKAQAELENIKNGTAPKFEKEHQGIYNRYKKTVEKYLDSIGGQRVSDDKGNTWIEVPVEPHRRRPIMFGQRGFIDIGDLLPEFGKRRDKVANMLKGLGNYIPSDPDMELVRQAALQEPDGKGFTNLLESGATSAAANKRSSLILGASRVVQNASKRAELAVRQFVFPVEDAARKLSRAELRTVSELMMDEMKSGQLYDRELLQGKLSDKQLKAYIAAREMFEQTYLMQNEARLAKGLPAFSKMEAYAASRWEGDFRMPVRNAEGKLVWYLAGDSVRSVKKQLAELQKIEPGLVSGELRRINTRNAKGIASVYHTMLDMLDQNDPTVEKIRTLFEAEKSIEAMDMLNQTKHHERKSGVRGFVGDRPWMNPEKEATAFMQQQIQYAKNAFEWSEMQGAAEKLKSVLSDPELQKVQPNNLQYVKDYLETNLGFGEAKLVKEIDNTIRKAGISPKYIAEAIGSTKLLFTLQKMALSTGYIASNILQTTWMLPHLMDLRNKGFKGNPVGSLAVGYSVGAWLALNHWSKRGVGIDSTPDFGSMVPGALGEFYAKAMKYAEDNGVTSRSIYDESQIETSMSPVKRAVDVTAKATMAFPETIVRASSFMAYVEMLRQSGQFKDNDAALFQKAEEMVNFSMVDYRYGERPMMFSKMGWAGNAANTLQTYPISFYNQWRYFAKEAANGNVVPFMTAFALQMALAGAMGIPGVSDLDKLWDLAKKMLPASMWANIPEDSFLADPKLWALDNIGEKAVYGLLSDQTDISFTSRVAAPGLADMAAAPFGPAGDLLKQATNWASAAKGDPADIAQAALSSAPIGPVQGLLENTVFRDETGVDLPGGTRGVFKSTDLAGRDQIYERDDWDTLVRNMGMRSQREAVTKEVQYRLDNLKSIKNEKGASLAESWYNNVRRGNLEKAKERAELYFKLTGKPITSTQFANQAKQEFLSTQKRMAIGADTVNEVKRYQYLKQLLEGVE